MNTASTAVTMSGLTEIRASGLGTHAWTFALQVPGSFTWNFTDFPASTVISEG